MDRHRIRSFLMIAAVFIGSAFATGSVLARLPFSGPGPVVIKNDKKEIAGPVVPPPNPVMSADEFNNTINQAAKQFANQMTQAQQANALRLPVAPSATSTSSLPQSLPASNRVPAAASIDHTIPTQQQPDTSIYSGFQSNGGEGGGGNNQKPPASNAKGSPGGWNIKY